MKINWKCVWRVLKPYIIGLALILTFGGISFFGFGLLVVMVGNISQASDAMVVGTTFYGSNVLSVILLIIGGFILIYYLIQFLRNVLKPCITWEEN